jgi:hypothetical protein
MSKGARLMTITSKQNKSTKLAMGAALVALSGHVPDILINEAHADTATIKATGTFSSGLSVSAVTNLIFGTMVATDTTGFVQILPNGAGGATSANNAFFIGAPQEGQIGFSGKAVAPVDMTISANWLPITLTGAAPVGQVTISKVMLAGVFTKATIPFTVLNTTEINEAIAGLTTDIFVGARVIWSGAIPIGKFQESIKLTIAY